VAVGLTARRGAERMSVRQVHEEEEAEPEVRDEPPDHLWRFA
jgi:hypothetical protein